MDDEKQKRTVKITIPLSDGKSAFFSGYLIGAETLITCRHGFTNFDSYDDQEPIIISTQEDCNKINISGSQNFKKLIENNHVLYESSEYDVVLLKCSLPQTNFDKIFFKNILSKDIWEGGGYPYFNRNNKSEGYTDLDGKVINSPYSDHSVTLSVNTRLEDMDHWQEVSGSPIFINGQLAGLIYEYIVYEDKNGGLIEIQHQFRAVKLQYLWENDSDFRRDLEKLRPPPKSLDKLRKLLEVSDTSLKESLEEYLGINDTDNLVEVIARKNKIELMKLSLVLKANGVKEAENFLLLAMTYQYEGQECFKTAKDFYYAVAFVGDIPCEFSMAAEDDRDPIFLKEGENIYAGKYSLTAPPESGIESQASLDLADDITSKLAAVDLIHTRLSEDFKTKRKLNKKQRISAAINVLKKAKGSYYWQLGITTDNSKIVEQIAKEFSSIKIIKIPEDTDELTIEIAENELFEELHHFIKG